MAQQKLGQGTQLMIEALAGATAAVAVALLARKVHALRRHRREAGAQEAPDGAPRDLGSKLVEIVLLRLAFRSILQGVRFTGGRLLA